MRYVFEEWTLDTEQYLLYKADLSIPLQPKVFQVLQYLLTNRDRVIAKQELCEQVWPEQFISDATVESVIKAIRRAVGDDGRTQWCIQTRRGQGYRFVATLIESDADRPVPEAVATTPTPFSTLQLSLLPTEPVLNISAPSRRQLTVMFCDLVDSTLLSTQLDPEDLQEVTLAYYAACTEVIERFDGTIANYLGDGLMIFFGYPHAHEDDAQRAVRTGLGILDALDTLNRRLERDFGVRLDVRVGIHTGLVVIGSKGETGPQTPFAFGQTLNIAARLHSLARAHQVVLSEHTQRLAGAAFDYEDLGAPSLQGVATPIQVYAVRGAKSVLSRFDAATASGLASLIGREEELRLILRRWEQAKGGEGQVVLLSGEAGIGKSRLIRAVRERLATEPHTPILSQCSPYHRNSAFHPIAAQLEHAAQLTWHDTPDEKLDKLEALLAQSTEAVIDVAPLFAAILSIPTGDRYLPLHIDSREERVKTIEALVDQIVGLAAHQPVLCLVEDVHWCDPTSLEALDQLVHRIQDVPVLVVITYRPEFDAQWTSVMHATALTLNRLGRLQSTALIHQITMGKVLPTAVSSEIVAKADGIPLFVEELTKAVIESKWLYESADEYELLGPLPALAIPATLQDALTERLDRLDTAKTVAQLAATIGREFSYALLQVVSPFDEETLQHEVARLVDAELLYPRGVHPQVIYVFKHALIQETAYRSLLRKTRQQSHRQIASALEECFAETIETQPELLAYHYTEAGCDQEAVLYWYRAGQQAVKRSAHAEAIAHLTKGLMVLDAVPDSLQRTEQELMLHITLGAPLLATKGYADAEVGQVFSRARALCQHLEDPERLFQVLQGLWSFYLVRAELPIALELSEQLVDMAHRLQDDALLLEASGRLGISLFLLGQLVPAQAPLAKGLALYDPTRHRSHAFLYGQDPKVAFLCHSAWLLWLLGYPDRALQSNSEALSLARELSHPHSLSWAHLYAALVHTNRREWPAAQEQAEALIALSSEQGFAYRLAQGRILQGWTLVQQGQGEGVIEQMKKNLAFVRATGAAVYMPYFRTLLAETYGCIGRSEEGVIELSEVLTLIDKTGERFYEATVYRAQGEWLLKLADDRQAETEACFQQALTSARQQQAKSLELEAAISLSQLWQRQGRGAEAYPILAEIYGWFTEGFDTDMLQRAKTLLDQLA